MGMGGTSGQHLLAKLQAHLTLAQCKCGNMGFVLRWTPGHNGIHKNKRADEEAKRAGSSKSSPVCLLPKACRGDIPVSRSAHIRGTYRTLREELLSSWSSP